MKKVGGLLFIGTALLIATSACSKCYECKQTIIIEDTQGNPIDTNINVKDVCTSKRSEIDDKEKQGFKCS